jgi:alpha-L-arabinofuranosidase
MAGPTWPHRVMEAEFQSKNIEIKIMNSPIQTPSSALVEKGFPPAGEGGILPPVLGRSGSLGFLRCVGVLPGSLLALVLGPLAQSPASQPVMLTVRADQPGPRINRAMWGVFFEDINFGADGGLYAELVKNGAFEFPDPFMGWTKLCPAGAENAFELSSESPFSAANPHYLRLHSDGSSSLGIANQGFRGIGVRAGEPYDFSAQVRVREGTPALEVQLASADGKVLASTRFTGFSQEWKKYSSTLVPTATDPKASLILFLATKGALEMDVVSLFPRHTWKERPGGLRADMVQMLADLRPGFMRFPGGCIVEGSQLDRRYQWKRTLGPVEKRQLLINRWNYEFKHRPAPDYFQSFGLGFFEFFQLCEDIGAQPLPILNCGMACQFNSGELVPLTELDSYIQDALDLVEFANGPATSVWGAKRAALGHPEPFQLKMLGVGNEQWGPQYLERYARFARALKQQHPDLLLVSSAGPSPADDRFNFLWPKLRELHADLIDEHCYALPDWFFSHTHRYDQYDRTGPKVFMGEYAAQSVAIASPDNKNNWECALSEAAYMIGLERNADVVRLASYAPLFAHTDAWQWTPDLIWADNLQVYGTPSYYVQQLFSRNRGDLLLPTALDTAHAGDALAPRPETLFASAVFDEHSAEIALKLVNASPQAQKAAIRLQGIKTVRSGAKALLLTSARLNDVNSFQEPRKIAPREMNLKITSPDFQHTAPASSLMVLRIPVSR